MMVFIEMNEILQQFDPYKETSVPIPEIRDRIIHMKHHDVRDNDSCSWVEYYVSPKVPTRYMCEKCGYATDKVHALKYCGMCGRRMIGFRYPKRIKNIFEDQEEDE